jgi:hypothetical protein
MRFKLAWLLAAFSLVIFLGACGHLDGNNPLGVTGGGSSGYGVNGPLAGGETIDIRLQGRWRHDYPYFDYYILRFNADGSFRFDYYAEPGILDHTYQGSYRAFLGKIQFQSNGLNGSYPYSVSSDTLTIWFHERPDVLFRQ